MRFSVSAASATALLAGVSVAEPLTVITPCAGANITSAWPITVTQQHQTVSTCAPTSACVRGTCTTKYPFETFAYVSTVIPAAWDGKAAQTTTVTSTAQAITVSRFQSTLTQWVTPAVTAWSGTTTQPKPTPIYLTIAKDFVIPYNKLGPLAIPGYGGSGLCQDCDTKADGSRSQVVGVTECRAGPGGSKCMGYDETWISKSAPSTSATTANPCSTRWVAPSAGTYTFTFPFVAPARTITAADTTITVAPVPYWAHVTRVCNRAHEVIDFTTTITKTITWTAPPFRQPPKTSSAVPVPTGSHAFAGWPRPGRGNGLDGGVEGSKGDPYSWADWGSDDASDPSKPIPSNWADWVATGSTAIPTTTSTSSVSRGPFGHSTSSGWSFTSTTSSTDSPSASSTYSFSHGPNGGSTTWSSAGSTVSTSTSTSGVGPIGGSTTSSSISTTTSISTTSVVPTANTATPPSTSTSSVDATTTSTITTFTTSTSATTTSAPATTTSLVAVPVDPKTFVIGVGTATKYRKRALQYIKIASGGDATLTPDKADATQFSLSPEGYLMVGDLFVDTDTSQGWLSFSLTTTLSPNSGTWTLGADGTVSLAVPNNGICVSSDNSVFIQFSGSTPFSCADIVLAAEVPNPTSTSTTSGASTTAAPTTTTFVATTTSEAASTTTSFDPSGDLDADIPAPTNVRRGVQYGGPKFGRRRH